MLKTKLMLFLFILLSDPLIAIARESDNLNAQVYEAYKAGQYSKASVLAEQNLKLIKKEFGPKHPTTLDSMNILAELYRLQGHYNKVVPLYNDALSISKDVKGFKHPDTLIIMNNLALLLYA